MKRVGNNEIQDNEIRILGSGTWDSPKQDDGGKNPMWVIGIVVAAILFAAVALGAYFILGNRPIRGYFESQIFEPTRPIEPITLIKDASLPAYFTVVDTLVVDTKFRIYYPHNAIPSLSVGLLDTDDESIVFAAQAADIRADNMEILGSFVMDGNELSKGASVKGFCAVVGNQISLGYSKSTNLFEQAIDNNGYFFRQYCLVAEGQPIDNNQNRRYVRKALCTRGDDIFIVETRTGMSMWEFSHTLIEMGVEYALNLVGTTTYGWYTDKGGTRHEFSHRPNESKIPENTSYIVWR